MPAAALHSSSYNSNTSTGSRGCGWGQLAGPHHDWTSRGAGPPPLALCAVSQPHAWWAWVGADPLGSVVPAPEPSPQPGGQRPKGEVGAGGATFGLDPTLTAEGACTAAAGTRVRRQGTLRRSGGRPAPGAPIGWGRGRSASPATSRAQRLPDPTGRGRTGCPASVPPHQPEGGGRRGNLGSSGPPFEQSLPQALSCRKGEPGCSAPSPRARGGGTGSRPAAAQGPRGPRVGSPWGCGSRSRLPKVPAPHGPRARGPQGQGHRPRRRARALTGRALEPLAPPPPGPRAPKSGRIVGEGAQGAMRRRLGRTSPKRGAGTSSRGEVPGPPRPARPAPRLAVSAPQSPPPQLPVESGPGPWSPSSLRVARGDEVLRIRAA